MKRLSWQPRSRLGAGLRLAAAVMLVLGLTAVPSARPAAGGPAPVQIYYVSMPEADALTIFQQVNNSSGNTAYSPMYTYFSIAIAVDGTIVYYDQWEDGYAGIINSPTPAEIYDATTNPAGVQIWGNGVAADGCAPNITGVPVTCIDANDHLYAGNVIIPYNSMDVPRVVAAQKYVLDQFSSRVYTRQDGNTNWSTNWVETGDDGSPTGGTISVQTSSSPSQLRFTAAAANASIYRGVDLSAGGDCATLSFTLGQSGIDDNEDRLVVEASADGTNYTTLDTYTSSAAAGAKSYSISGFATADTRIRFRMDDPLESGEYWSIDDVRVDWDCRVPVKFDARDKIGATSSIAMARAVWPSGHGTLDAFGHEMYATAEWGLAYESPVGTNTTTGTQFGYSGLSIMASQNNTSVQIDADANGTYETTITLHEGGSYLASSIRQGARVVADKPVQVVLATGQLDSNYASRDMNLLPTSAYGTSYWSPVGVVNSTYPTRLYLYNPSTNGSIYITCEKYGASNVTLGPVAARGTVQTDLTNGQGARCYASNSGGTATGEKIFGVGTVDTNNTAYDWSFTMYPDSFLTTQALVGLGLGKDPTNTTSTENASPLWVTAACSSGSTYVYVDWNNDGVADLVDTNGDGTNEANSNNGISVPRLQSVKLYRANTDTQPYDQSGARVWSCTTANTPNRASCTTPGCPLALAWGEDPARATAGAPGLDVGTSVPPLRLIEGSKALEVANDTAPLGILNPGDRVYYNSRSTTPARGPSRTCTCMTRRRCTRRTTRTAHSTVRTM